MHDPIAAPSPLSAWLAEGWEQHATVREVDVEGATVRYRAWGCDDRDKPGLVLAHGFLAHARWWDHIAPRLTDRYRVIAPDFTGMGDSDRRPAYSRHQYARELIAATRHAGFEQAIFVAHSFGSSSALYAATLAPDLIERVIVIDVRAFPREEARESVIRPEAPYPSFEAARARFRLSPPGPWPIPEILDYIAGHSIRRIDDARWGWKFDPETIRAVQRERLGSDLDTLVVPVDFIHAANSEVVNDTDLAIFLAKVPTCGPPVTIPLSHHHIMIEQPIALVAALNALLAHPRRA